MAYKKSNPNGSATSANSEPVVIASDQSAVPVSGTVTANIGTVATLATAAKQDTGNTSVASIDTKTPALGQALAAASVPVILPSATITTLTPPAAITNFANETGGNLAAIKAKTDNIPAQGQALAAGSLPVVLTAAQMTTLTPPAQGLTDAQLRATAVPISVASVPSHAVTNAGTFATQVFGAALTALQLIDDTVFADDAAVTLSTSKGNLIEGVAVATDGTDPTAVSAEGDAAALRTDMNRILLVNTTPPRLVSATENNATAQTNNPIHSAPGAGLSLYITDIVVSNGATAGSIKFVEDTAGTPVIKVQETYMAINGGAVMSFKTPIRITANKDFGYTSTTVTTHSITVNGYIAP